MTDLDLAKLPEQIARALCRCRQMPACYPTPCGIGPCQAPIDSLLGECGQWNGATTSILALLRPALQAAWTAGRDASADHIEGTWWDEIEAGRIAEHIRALTPPDYLTGGDDVR